MANIHVRDVPDDVHQTLRARAAAEGKSLQEYALGLLTSNARRPTLSQVLDRVGQHTGGRLSPARAVELLREDRDGR
jgi:hypothetical protein